MKFLDALKKPAWLVAVVTLSVSALFTLLYYAGMFGGGFMPVISNLIAMILSLGIIGGLLFFLITKKYDLFKYFFVLYFFYWILTAIYRGLDAASFAVNGMPGYAVAWGVFEFLAALGLLGVFVLFILGKLLKKESFKSLTLLVMLGTSALFFLVMILYIVVVAKGNWGWANYFDAFNTFLLPVGLTFAYLALGNEDLPAEPAKEVAEEPAVEEEVVEEPVVEEEVVEEETPAEEPEEETPASENKPFQE